MRTIHLLSAALGLLLMASGARSAETPLYLDTDTIWSDKTMGFGFQWDPSDVWDYTDAQWQRVVERVDFIRPQFVRVCTSAGHYCRGFDAQGQRIYQWDSAPAKRLLRILDYCQQRGVAVMLGEWGAPFGMSWDDPRWSRVIGDCVEYLVRQRGYRCIRYYNKIKIGRAHV